MKKLLFILSCLMLLSCKPSSGSANSAVGKGTITCTMDGKSKTFQAQNGFTEIRFGGESKGPNDALMLLDGDKTREGFQFEIKNNGTSLFKGMDGVLNMFSYFNSKGADYVAKGDVTATVASFSGNHLSGTFSGKFENTYYKGASDSSPEFIQIKDGKFDLIK